MGLVYAIHYTNEDYEMSRVGLLINMIPLMSIFSLIYVAVDYLKDLHLKYREFKHKKRFIEEEKKRLREERELKIKKGIIKITPEDPYGEENWEPNQ